MTSPADRGIGIGIIGMGSMGRGLLYQSHITPGVECRAVCDTRVERCTAALEWLGLPHRVVHGPDALEDTVREGLVAVCETGDWVSRCSRLAAVVEATNSIAPGARHAIAALEHHKHLVLMNSEIDLTFGPLLARLAMDNGVVCTSCDGDQYGVIKHLVDDLRLWGFGLVMAGNIKGYLDRSANPTTIVPEADKRNIDHRMCTSYTDGTKLNIEMAIIANACGLRAGTPGMHGPRAAHVNEVFQHFDFDALWADRQPFVDYLLGAEPGGGVFAIGHCDNPYQREMLAYYKMGAGPYYLFYRPFHLCHIEAIGTVIGAAREGSTFLRPDHGFRTNVYAYAKTDLKPGDRLDGIGGYTCYGKIENLPEGNAAPGLPVCLADDLAVVRALARDERIALSDVIHDPERLDFKLYTQALACPVPAAMPREA